MPRTIRSRFGAGGALVLMLALGACASSVVPTADANLSSSLLSGPEPGGSSAVAAPVSSAEVVTAISDRPQTADPYARPAGVPTTVTDSGHQRRYIGMRSWTYVRPVATDTRHLQVVAGLRSPGTEGPCAIHSFGFVLDESADLVVVAVADFRDPVTDSGASCPAPNEANTVSVTLREPLGSRTLTDVAHDWLRPEKPPKGIADTGLTMYDGHAWREWTFDPNVRLSIESHPGVVADQVPREGDFPGVSVTQNAATVLGAMATLVEESIPDLSSRCLYWQRSPSVRRFFRVCSWYSGSGGVSPLLTAKELVIFSAGIH